MSGRVLRLLIGRCGIVELLVQHGVENTMAGGYHGSVLMAAPRIPALVSRDSVSYTPLRAAGQHHIGIVQTLYQRRK